MSRSRTSWCIADDGGTSIEEDGGCPRCFSSGARDAAKESSSTQRVFAEEGQVDQISHWCSLRCTSQVKLTSCMPHVLGKSQRGMLNTTDLVNVYWSKVHDIYLFWLHDTYNASPASTFAIAITESSLCEGEGVSDT